MRALTLNRQNIEYITDVGIPKLTSHNDVLVRVFYAGICRTDVDITKGIVPAKEGIILGHEFCGMIVGLLDSNAQMGSWSIGDCVSANPMSFGVKSDVMCGKDCDGAFAEYIAVPHKALVSIPPCLLSPMGAFLEPVAAALAPLKFIEKKPGGRICIFGQSRIAELACQIAKIKGYRNIDHVVCVDDLKQNYYDYIVETEAKNIDAYADALKPHGTLILKSRSFAPSLFTANTIAMKEIGIQGARYGDFNEASTLLTSAAQQSPSRLDTGSLFGNIYQLSQYQTAYAEASLPNSKKTFFKICAE